MTIPDGYLNLLHPYIDSRSYPIEMIYMAICKLSEALQEHLKFLLQPFSCYTHYSHSFSHTQTPVQVRKKKQFACANCFSLPGLLISLYCRL